MHAVAPQAKVNQKTSAWPVIRSATRAGSRVAPQMLSFRNAWPPRPAAKKANRQLSCSISPGSVRPSAMKAAPAVPPTRIAATSAAMPVSSPTEKAVPVLLRTPRRHARTAIPLYLTISGSVDSPRKR